MKVKKRKKSSRMHGRKMGTHGTGARKKQRHSGMKGGKGMSGSGKRADHKKTKITKLYGHTYFGRKGVTSRSTKRDTRQRINLRQIESNLEKYGKKKGDAFEINLPKHKILGEGEARHRLIIKAKEASKSAIDKVKKAGGDIQIKVHIQAKKEKEKIPKKSAEETLREGKEEEEKVREAVKPAGAETEE